MGLLAGYFAFKGGEASQHWRLFLTTGILGGYTTFSAFSLDTVLLYERGEIGAGGALRAGLGRSRRSAACSRAWRWCGISPDAALASILHVIAVGRRTTGGVSWL